MSGDTLCTPCDAEISDYTYETLAQDSGKQIRLLVLQQGPYGAPIQILIKHVNLEDTPIYEASSYTWAAENGDSSLSEAVSCQGKYINVTQNCASMLRRLRKREEERVLWVDAICINQSSTTERNHQVEMMHLVYRQAERVVIYLGDDMVSTSPFGIDSASVEKLFAKRWFSRVWCIQEFALAKHALMIAGDHSVLADALWLKKVRSLAVENLFPIPAALRWQPGDSRKLRLSAALAATRQCLATEPKDKIFAIYGIVNHSSPKVDYSMPMAELMMRVAVSIVYHERSLNVLSHTRPRRPSSSKALDIPSWVPDWTDSSVVGAPPTIRLGTTGAASVEIIEYRGVRPPRPNMVQLIVPSDWHAQMSPMPFLYLRAQNLGSIAIKVCDEGQTADAFQSTISQLVTKSESVPFESVSQIPKELTQLVPHGVQLDEDGKISASNLAQLQSLANALARRAGGRCLAVAEKERHMVVLAPDQASLGDSIWTIEGCCVVFVLRNIGDDRYKIIGDCRILQWHGEFCWVAGDASHERLRQMHNAPALDPWKDNKDSQMIEIH